jgi:hypothetical protein
MHALYDVLFVLAKWSKVLKQWWRLEKFLESVTDPFSAIHYILVYFYNLVLKITQFTHTPFLIHIHVSTPPSDG